MSYATSMVKCVDGRTMTGCKRQRDTFSKHADTHDDCNELKVLITNTEVCYIFHPSRILNEPDETINKGIEIIEPILAAKDWSSEVHSSLLSRNIIKQRKLKDWKPLYSIVDPWMSTEYSLANPCVCSMPTVNEAGRIQICNRVLYKETLVVMIGEGQPSHQEVNSMSKITHEQLNEHDIVEMDGGSVDARKDYKRIWEFIMTLADFTNGIRYKDFQQ